MTLSWKKVFDNGSILTVMERNYIPGIYNWCDRWCEKCKFNDRCSLYAKEQEEMAWEDAEGMDAEDFMEMVSKNLNEAMDLIHKLAEEKGINLQEEAESEENKISWEEMRKQEEALDQHPLVRKSFDYLDASRIWIGSECIKNSLDQLEKEIALGLKNEAEGETEFQRVKDALESVQWFQTMIPVKNKSALNSSLEREFWDSYPPEERHYNGTAKLALLCIERSINAWETLMKWMPEEESILDRLADLQQMESMLNQEFPDAKKFIRPGFDENL